MFNTAYYSSNPKEIDQSIEWLTNIKLDCELKINELQRIKSSQERLSRHRQKFDDLAREFARDEFINLPKETQLAIIMQRFDVTKKQAENMIVLAKRRCKIIQEKARNIRIAKLYEAQIPVQEIANDVKLSRQAVYTVIGKHKENPLF